MKKIPMELIERAYDCGVHVSYVLHVQGALVNSEDLEDEVRDFLLDMDDQTKSLEIGWPSIRADLLLDRVDDYDDDDDFLANSRADLMMRRCPAIFLVQMATTNWECRKAAEAEGCGSWTSCGSWLRWYAVDDVGDALLLAVEKAEGDRLESWRKAVSEGRIYANRTS